MFIEAKIARSRSLSGVLVQAEELNFIVCKVANILYLLQKYFYYGKLLSRILWTFANLRLWTQNNELCA